MKKNTLFLSFSSFPDVTDEMLAFFLTLFQALRVQMGVAFTGQIIHTFLSMFTRLTLLTPLQRAAGGDCSQTLTLFVFLTCALQGATGSQHPAGGQRRVPGGAKVLKDPAGGGAGAGSSIQTLPAQHHLSLHGAGLPRGGRGQSLADRPCRVFILFLFFFNLLILSFVHSDHRQTSRPRCLSCYIKYCIKTGGTSSKRRC